MTNISELKIVDGKDRDRVFQVQVVPAIRDISRCVFQEVSGQMAVEKGEQVHLGVSCCQGSDHHGHDGGVCCEKFGEFCCEP